MKFLAPITRFVAAGLMTGALALTVAPTTTPVASASGTTSVSTAAPSQGYVLAARTTSRKQVEVINLLNEARSKRTKCGNRWYPAVGPLRTDAKLTLAATRWSKTMANDNFIAHERGRSTPAARIEAAGYNWRSYGENIAGGQTTPAQVVAGWMASPGHCKNVMGAYRDAGIGYAYNAAAQYRTYWTLDLGTR